MNNPTINTNLMDDPENVRKSWEFVADFLLEDWLTRPWRLVRYSAWRTAARYSKMDIPPPTWEDKIPYEWDGFDDDKLMHLLGKNDDGSYWRWSPILKWHRIVHHFLGPYRGCSCSKCFHDPRRKAPAGELDSWRRRALNAERMMEGRFVVAPSVLADSIRDWVHESPLNRCNLGTDTCESWPVVDEIMKHIIKRIDKGE